MAGWFKRKREEARQRKEAEEAAKQQRLEDLRTVLQGISDGECPVNFPAEIPIMLKKGEETRLCLPSVDLMEARAVRHYSGGGVRIAKGVTVGGGRSQSRDELKNIDSGALVLTNTRLVFSGSKRTTNVSLDKIISVTAYRNGIALHRERKQKTEYFLGVQHYPVSFIVDDRVHETKFSGTYLKAYIEGAVKLTTGE